MKFAELLKQERTKNKISLRQLAKLSGLPLSSVAKYENGEMEPTLRAAHTVFSVLGASIAVGAHSGYTPLERKVKHGNGRHAGLNH